jgi:hypothetical protein
MNVKARVLFDDSELMAAIEELTLFGEALFQFSPSLVDRFVGFVHSRTELASIDWTTAEGTCRCSLKPSDRLADLLLALRAGKLNGRVVGDNVGHKLFRLRSVA